MNHFDQAAVNILAIYRYLQELAERSLAPYAHFIGLGYVRGYDAWVITWKAFPPASTGDRFELVRAFPAFELGHIRDNAAYVVQAAEALFDNLAGRIAEYESRRSPPAGCWGPCCEPGFNGLTLTLGVIDGN